MRVDALLLRASAALLAVASVAHTTAALADDVGGAANAFSKAQKAELSGDSAAAAELFELADSLAASPEALRAAIRARKAAGQLSSAAIDAEALRSRYPDDAKSKELADATLALAATTLARYEIRCHPGTCSVVVDGSAASADAKDHHVLFLDAGRHEVMATFGRSHSPAQTAEGAPGSNNSLDFDAPKVLPRADAGGDVASGVDFSGPADAGVKSNAGLPPWAFITGAVVTVGLGAATLWSGLDTLKAHDHYDHSQEQYDAGVDKERRTNILIAGTAVAGVATGVIAVFTRWKAPAAETAARPSVRASVGVLPQGSMLSISGVY